MRYTASHSVVCDVPPALVHGLISRSRDWPGLLDPCESVTVLSEGEGFEHIEVTARVGGETMTWQSRRRFLPEVLGVEAEIVRPMKLVAAMRTLWRVVAVNSRQSLLLLEHEYDLCDDVTGQVEGVTTREEAARFIHDAVDANSTVELGNIKAAVERAAGADEGRGRDFHARHSVVCAAPAGAVYGLIRSTASWPRIFDACLDVTRVEGDEESEVVRVGAEQDGRRVTWDTRRRYLDAIHRVDYELLVPMPFVESMRGQWRVVPLGPGHCLLTVDRHWRMLADVTGVRAGITTVAEAAAVVRGFVDDNARAEMDAIRAFAEDGTEALTSVTTRVRVAHAPDEVYALLADVAGWPKLLPHCASLEIRHDDGRDQEFTMRVDTASGPETFRSVRHCDEQTLAIGYFQPEPPSVLRAHRGSWEVRGHEGGCEVVARHTALLDPEHCAKEFGTDDLRSQKRRVRQNLERNSRLTIEACARRLDETAEAARAGETAATATRLGETATAEAARAGETSAARS